MLLRFLGFISALLFIATATSQQASDQLTHNGITRNFYYYTPTTWNGTDELPLLIVLHGLTQTGAGVMGITGFNDIAEANQIIVCYPDGIGNAWNANMNVTVSQEDDLGFIETLATHFQTNFNTNPMRQYLCGFSNGGFMSHKMVCESTMCFAGIATVSGGMSDTVYQNCNPSYSPSILHIHGTSDPVVAYNGSASTGISVDAMLEFWRNYMSCDASPTTAALPNPNLLDFSSPELITYTNCAVGALEHIKITGGGHQWPGISTLIGGLGTINMDFYSPQIIWDFLSGLSCEPLAENADLSPQCTQELVKIVDFLGRETPFRANVQQLYIYSNGTVGRMMVIE